VSARDEAVEMIRRICPAHLSADEYGRILAEKFDAHRTEVLNEAAEILRARAAQYPTRRVFAAGLRHGALIVAKAAMGRTER
jgi:hypothetical protein